MAVPVARRNLFQSRARLIISVGGIALAALLVLVLDGVFAGSEKDVTVFMDNTPFDLVVSQRGVRNLHMTTSFFPEQALRSIEQVSGVERVDPILFTTTFLIAGDLPTQRGLAYLIGYEPGRLGGPWAWAGRPVELGPDEIVIDIRAAEDFGVSVGDEITAAGRDLRIAGLAEGTTSIVNSISFVTFEGFQRAQGVSGTVSFALVLLRRDENPAAVADRIQAAVDGVTVQTRADFAESERRIVSDMSIDIMRLMNIIAFLIGLSVTGLTVYVATLAKVREYGLMKAIGARNSRLFRLVIGQAAMSLGLGLSLAVAVALVLQVALGAAAARIPMVVEPESIARIIAGATVIGLLGAVIPVARVAGLKPADVFRR
ncbi:MAG: FtsX-like permease family protein [Coriobacteriia bacterium]|nr:FtsX-like permease family protein [Coriobacteriia bacterium]